MDRRKMMMCGAGSLCAAAAAQGQSQDRKPKVKITVLKRELYEDLSKEYRNGRVKRCDVFKDGQEINVASQWSPPDGFCEWAWADIRRYVQASFGGAERPQICCCTDGYRPVVFKVEKLS